MKHTRKISKLPKPALDLTSLFGTTSSSYDPFQQLMIVLTKGAAAKLF